MNDVVAVVVDESQSQAIAGRTERTEAVRKDLEEKLKAFPNLDLRFVRSTSTSADSERDGTMLFTDLGQALADVPPDRLAGVIMITEGEVHDVPGAATALGFDAPVHALITGKEGEFDRRLQVLSAPRFGIVGSAQPVEVKITETTAGQRQDSEFDHHPSGPAAGDQRRPRRREDRDPRRHRACRARTSSRSRPRPHPASSPPSTTVPCSRSRACARTCACCSSPASLMPASAPGAIC